MSRKGSFILSIFICLFAIGSWIDLNGVWVELPLLVNRLPEGWKLPTFIVAIVQIANIAPLIYMGVFHWKKFPNMERFTIYFILSIGCVSCAFLSVFWNFTSKINIFGKMEETSVALFVLILILSMIDTTSSVTFLPYLINYPRQYVTALYFGEGLSGLLPGIAGLIQGVGGEGYCTNQTIVENGTSQTKRILIYPPPRFSIFGFFLLLCAILLICLFSFAMVDNVKYFQKYKTKVKPPRKDRFQSDVFYMDNQTDTNESETELLLTANSESQPKSKKKWIIFVLIVAYINFFTNGVLPSLQNYTLMPYSVTLYHLVVTISQILNPLACLLTLRKWKTSNLAVGIMTTIASIGTAYLIFLASKSPVPVLNSTVFGQILAASCWFVVSILFSFEKALLAIELQKQGHIWLQLCGASTQIGSSIGALLIFILVVVLDLFKSKNTIC